MSIPPLVCTTPPPPDQCEDERDHDEFTVDYHVAVEDFDETPYLYDEIVPDKDFSRIHSNTAHFDEFALKDAKDLSHKLTQQFPSCEERCDQLRPVKGTIRLDEDNNIEDLDLSFDDVLQEKSSHIEASSEFYAFDNFSSDSSIQNESINHSNSPESNENENTVIHSDVVIKSEPNNQNNHTKCTEVDYDSQSESAESHRELPHIENSNISPSNSKHTNTSAFTFQDSIPTSVKTDLSDFNVADASYGDSINTNNNGTTDVDNIHSEKAGFNVTQSEGILNESDEEFDAFNSADTGGLAVTSGIEDSPFTWGEAEPNTSDESSGFGNFNAFQEADQTADDTLPSNGNIPRESDCISKSEPAVSSLQEISEDDNDFGDFDEFKSANDADQGLSENEGIADGTAHPTSVFRMDSKSSDLQVYESLESIIRNIYPCEDLSPTDSCFTGKLESALSETWGHILEVEKREPYIPRWANSVCQNSLLKALNIDSRNILFVAGLKPGVPAFAATMGSAPLQPSRPSAPAATATAAALPLPTNAPSADIPLCTEKGIRDTVITTEANTQNELADQTNFRHISLPDTHIYTPSDSHTPQSQTIHHNSPGVTNWEVSKSDLQAPTVESVKDLDITERNCDKEDMEFNDFQGASVVKEVSDTADLVIEPKRDSKNSNNTFSKETTDVVKSLPYATSSILEPVKLEPAVPVLNWPDPGQVAETFDDFSEFVAHTDSARSQVDTTASKVVVPSPKQNMINENVPNLTKPTIRTENFMSSGSSKTAKAETVFDCFQSAKPTTSAIPSNPLPFMNKTNTSTIGNALKSNIPLTPIKTYSEAKTSGSNQRQSVRSDKSNTQILQPLSLESISQINWPSPGIDLSDLSRFNPVHSVHSLHQDKALNGAKETTDEEWGDFVSMRPNTSSPKHQKVVKSEDSDDWSDFVCHPGPGARPNDGLNTISFNVYSNTANKSPSRGPHHHTTSSDVPVLNYITPKTGNRTYNDHFQNL